MFLVQSRGHDGSARRSTAGAAGAATTDDELVRPLVARTCPTLGLTPRRHRVAATRGLPLATAERVVDRVHSDPAGLGPDALPAVTSRFADGDGLGLVVAAPAERPTAVDRAPPHLGRRQPQ